jgi:hypothetical protein
MTGAISYDLVMDADMSFVEGVYRLGAGEWQVCIFSKKTVEEPGWHTCTWESGVSGIVVHVPRAFRLNMASVEDLLSQALNVETWERVQGPDSMRLR